MITFGRLVGIPVSVAVVVVVESPVTEATGVELVEVTGASERLEGNHWMVVLVEVVEVERVVAVLALADEVSSGSAVVFSVLVVDSLVVEDSVWFPTAGVEVTSSALLVLVEVPVWWVKAPV